jgi:hypothetical protein
LRIGPFGQPVEPHNRDIVGYAEPRLLNCRKGAKGKRIAGGEDGFGDACPVLKQPLHGPLSAPVGEIGKDDARRLRWHSSFL